MINKKIRKSLFTPSPRRSYRTRFVVDFLRVVFMGVFLLVLRSVGFLFVVFLFTDVFLLGLRKAFLFKGFLLSFLRTVLRSIGFLFVVFLFTGVFLGGFLIGRFDFCKNAFRSFWICSASFIRSSRPVEYCSYSCINLDFRIRSLQEMLTQPEGVFKGIKHLRGRSWSISSIAQNLCCSDIGADFLGYNDSENLAKAVGMPVDSMCFTCSTGNYESLGITPEFKSRLEIKSES